MPERLKDYYAKTVVPGMIEQFGYKNLMQVPKIEKIVINMGVGDAVGDPRLLDGAVAELTAIAGQRAVPRKARKSVSNFKLREGVKIGCMVTLRGERMYEFMERLFNVAIPRIRDFRGVSTRGFDAQGNYTLGLKEQSIFPEVTIDTIMKARGMNVTFRIKNSRSAEESRELLRKMGMPFAN
jgi:large subunit ribosomal protein L5